MKKNILYSFFLYPESDYGYGQRAYTERKKIDYIKCVTGITGPAGKDGEAASFVVGTTDTGEPGSAAIVVNSGTPRNVVLDFIIPRGAVGPTGPAGKFTPADSVGDATDSDDLIIKFNKLLSNLRAAGIIEK